MVAFLFLVVFPPVRRLWWQMGFTLYPECVRLWCRLLMGRAPIRRRKDTEGDRNLSKLSAALIFMSHHSLHGHVLALQNPVCRSLVVHSRIPFEPSENNSKGIKNELLGSFKKVSLGEFKVGKCAGART